MSGAYYNFWNTDLLKKNLEKALTHLDEDNKSLDAIFFVLKTLNSNGYQKWRPFVIENTTYFECVKQQEVIFLNSFGDVVNLHGPLIEYDLNTLNSEDEKICIGYLNYLEIQFKK